MRKNILVTGGLGHIGSQIIRKLDHDITVVDNLLTQRYCSLFELDKKINFVESDFSELDSSFLSTFDEILHFGAVTDAAGSFDNKEELEKMRDVKKGTRYRKWLYNRLLWLSQKVFDTVEEEYQAIQKFPRGMWCKYDTTFKTKKEKKFMIEIAKNFGAFDY